jgi:hypothetical protein
MLDAKAAGMNSLRLVAFAPLMVAASAVACGQIDVETGPGGGSTTGTRTAPSGVFSNCQWLLTDGTFEGASAPATLTIAPICSPSGCSASALTATFVSGGTSTSVTLKGTSASSATLSEAGQGFRGDWGFCGGGAVRLDGGGVAVADPAPAAATLSLTSAELSVDQGVAIFQIEGPVIDVDGGPGCPADIPPAAGLSALLVCGTPGQGGGAPTPTTAPTSFAPGAYACTSTAATVVEYEGTQDHSTIGGSGTLTLAVDGANLHLVYSGDTNASGPLDFVATSDRSANPVPGQSITVGCGAINPTTYGDVSAPSPAAISAGTLTTDGTSLYLTFFGSTSSTATCPSQTSTTVLVCTKGP